MAGKKDIVEQALKLIAGAEPQKTAKAYKLFRQKDGKLYPLFVDADEEIAIGQWLKAKAGEQAASGKVKSKLGELAYRPGWHAGDLPIATHIGARSHKNPKLPPDTRPSNQVWAEVEMADDVDWQKVADERARMTKKGTPDPKTAHITDQVPYGGYYRYKTNPNMAGNWMIGGDMRVNRVLTDDEVKAINEAAGVADLPRREGYQTKGRVVGDVVKQALKLLSGEGDEAAQAGIRAYHGSPHDFDKFDMSKIGTGEGAQAYGHGLYFADREGIAKSYRDTLSPKNYLLNAPESEIAQKYGQDVLDMFSSHGGDPNEIKDTINRLSEQNKRDLYDLGVSDVSQVKPQNDWSIEANLVNRADRLNRLQSLLASQDVKINPGHMYEVNIAADLNTFLDWDKPLSEQPQHLLDVARPFFSEGLPEKKQYGEVVKGSDLYDMLVQRSGGVMHGPKLDAAGIPNRLPGGTKERLGMYLSSQGIPGIKYLDAGSRGAGEGTRNYVVFDDKLISIIRKYGIAGASAMLGYNLMENLDANQARAATAADMDFQSQKQAKANGGFVREGYQTKGRVVGDVVDQALKLIAGGVEEAGPSVAKRAADNAALLKEANRLGVNTNDIGALNETKALTEFHKKFMGDVRSRAAEALEVQKKLREQGAFPLEIGSRFTTAFSRENGQGPHTVKGYFVNPSDPYNSYGYRVRQDLGNDDWQEYDFFIRDPKAEARIGPEKWKEYQEGIQPFTPLRSVRAEGGSVREGYGPGGIIDDVVRLAGKVISGEGDDAAQAGIRAYHGSPHDFDKFDMSKIGTGEGAQAYGHGLYFAENEDVGKGYRDSLGAKANPTLKVGDDTFKIIRGGIQPGSKEDLLHRLWKGRLEFQSDYPDLTWDNELTNESVDVALAVMRAPKETKDWAISTLKNKNLELPNFGHMYEVNIAADPNTFLDWDKPLSEQPEAVRKGLEAAGFSPPPGGELMTGAQVYSRAMQNDPGAWGSTKEYVRAAMNELGGIPGIKYLDAGSRGKGVAQVQVMYKGKPHGDPIPVHAWNQIDQLTKDYKAKGYDVEVQDLGTRNYVVFDDKLISIIRKYGIAGASAMLGYNLMEQLDSKQALAATMADQDYKAGQLSSETDDIDDALRVAKDVGGGIGPVFMTDAKGISYDIKGNIIPPEVTGPNPARSEATPEQVGQRAAQDPATFDALMERYAVPDQDIARYEATKAEVAKQPYETQQMTHVGAPPMRDVKVDMPLFGGEQKITQAPYNVASGLSGMAQTAYDFKTAPLYMTPWTAPIGAGLDVAEGVATADPLQASLAALGAPGKYAKAAIIGGSNYFMSPAEAQAGPARWFSKAMEVARAIPMNKMTGEQALAMLRKGTSPEELRWMGAEDFLSGQKSVSKDDLVAFLEKNRVQPKEIVLGGRKPTRREDVRPTDTARAPFMDEWNSLKEQARALDAEYYALTPEQQALQQEDFWKRQFKIEDARTILKTKIVDATIAEMGGLGIPPKFQTHSTPGGQGYEETLITLPNLPGTKPVEYQVFGAFPATFKTREEAERHIKGIQEIEKSMPAFSQDIQKYPPKIEEIYEKPEFWEGHWDRPDVLAHVRSQILDVTPPGANRPFKGWNADEFQSKWGQEGRDEGFLTKKLKSKLLTELPEGYTVKLSDYQRSSGPERYSVFDPSGVEVGNGYGRDNAVNSTINYLNDQIRGSIKSSIEEAPYVTSTEGWTDLALKKSLDKAIDSGSDYFTWTPGEVHAKRYNLRSVVDEIQYDPKHRILFGRKDGRQVFEKDAVESNELGKYVGKEMASKLLSQPARESKWYANPRHVLSDEELEIGGEGMINYYDKIVPKRVEEVIRKATGKKPKIEIITVQTANGPRQQFGVRIDEDLRNARFSDFKKGGRVTGGNTYGNDNSVAHALALTSEY